MGMIMNYAFTNGKILNGTKDMQIQEGLCILVQEEKLRTSYRTQLIFMIIQSLICTDIISCPV